MASKTRKSMGTPASSQRTPSTSTPYGSSNPEKKGTLLSPALMQVKLELQNLNDRPATYIDRVRFLESENNRLSVQVHSSQETVTREVNNIKTMYQNELKDARQTLDDTAKEKAQLQIDLSNLKQRFDEVNQRLTKKEKELASTEKKLNQVDAYSQDLLSKFNQLASEKKKLEKSYQSESSKSQIKDLKALLEQEREWNSLALQAKDEELKNLRHDVEKQLQEYQDFLAMEIAAYRKILEVEENRLHITPVRAMEAAQRGTSVQKTPIRSTKRKCTVHESDEKSSSNIQISQSAKSDVEIVDHDREGKFIKIHNKGSTIPYDPVLLSHWNVPNSSQVCAVAESNIMPINQELTKQATNVPIPYNPVLFSHKKFPNSSQVRVMNAKEIKEEFLRHFLTKRKISPKTKLSVIQYMRSVIKLKTESKKSDLEEQNCSRPQLSILDIIMNSKEKKLFLRKRLDELERNFLKEAELEERRK